MVAVDGGGSYWHKRASGEDAGAMVLDELIPMLETAGTGHLAGRNLLGWSMGGYGALLLGSRLGPARTAAIAAVQPRRCGLSSGAAARGAFDGPDDFAANSVFGLPALASMPIRVDCGDGDPFYSATRAFVRPTAQPAGGRVLAGPGHDASFWSAQLPGELTWMAPLLTA